MTADQGPGGLPAATDPPLVGSGAPAGGRSAFRALVEASDQIVWTTDAHGSIVEDAPRWRALTGQRFDQLRSAGWLDSVHTDDRVRTARSWHDAIEARAPFSAEFRIRHADTGDWHRVSARAVPFHGNSGSVEGWVGTITDIDERHCAGDTTRELASLRTSAEQEERRRIAQVLHDDLQQRLYSVQMRIGLLREQAGSADPAETERVLREIEEWVASSVDLTHRLTVEISPPILEHEGLTESLEWLSAQMRDMHDLTVEVRADDSNRIDDEDVRVLLFQIVRELLFNVVKHAGTREATVDLRRSDGRLSIAVTDHGRGFQPGTADAGVRPVGGMGLSSARERLALYGGDLNIRSVPEDTTVINLTIPLGRDKG